ncbi:MAG: DUF995 domain-containing protein [Pseudomonadota bacterium]
MAFKFVLIACATALAALTAQAQTVGELLDKGAKPLTKEDYAALMPLKIRYGWPQGGGEGELVFAADGTLSGSEYQFSSRSESPAVGTWTVDDSGKWCMKKSMTLWKTNTDRCWITYRMGTDYYGGFAEGDRNSRTAKYKGFGKQ